MLCPACHVHTEKGFPFCLRCGRALRGTAIASLAPAELHPVTAPEATFELAKRVVTLGRNRDNDIIVDDGRVSRYHARIWREADGYRLEDLDSLNGTWVNDEALRGVGRTLNDGDAVRLGNAQLRFEQPRTDALGHRTMVVEARTTLLAAGVDGLSEGSGAAASSGPLEQRPRRRSGWALKQAAVEGRGEPRFVLRNTRTGQYVQLTERDCFLWNRLDGENTIRDLLYEYAQEYGQLALSRIQQLLTQLNAAGLLSGLAAPADPATLGRRIRHTAFLALMRMEFSIRGIDGSLGRMYRRFGWFFFTRAGLALVWGLVIAGVIGFIAARSHQSLFDVAGAGAWGVVAALAGYVVALTIHELAHALAVKSYGRRVTRGGLMVMMTMPYAFVDTSDMWFEKRGPRMVVSLAGPVATAAFGGIFGLGAWLLPGSVAPGVCYQVAFGLYLNTLFNFNPLVPLDGYYVLIDLLGQPRLREEASAYFARGLWRDIRAGVSPRRWRWGFFLYGAVSALATIGFTLLGLFMWRTRLGTPIHEHIVSPFDQVITVVGVVLIFFPVWYGPGTKLVRAVRRRRAPEQKTVELEAAPA